MKEFTSSISPKGQVTIPVEIRRLLGVRPKDKVHFQVEDDRILLTSAPITLEAAYGAVRPTHRPEDFRKLTKAAKEAHVKRVLDKMQKA